MKITEARFRNYLLGKSSDEDSKEIEIAMMTDKGVFQLFLIVESDLIEEYVDETLSDEDRQLFEKLFLKSKLRVADIIFMQCLINFAKAARVV